MKLGVIIPNYCTAMHHVTMLEQTLVALGKHEPSLLLRTFIVDDGSPLHDKQNLLWAVAARYGCRVVFKNKNEGYAKTVNRGLKHLRQKHCNVALTLNSDCEVTTPFQKTVAKVFNFDRLITVIGARLLYPNGRIQSEGQTVPKVGGVIEHHKMAFPQDDMESGNPRYVHSVQ